MNEVTEEERIQKNNRNVHNAQLTEASRGIEEGQRAKSIKQRQQDRRATHIRLDQINES